MSFLTSKKCSILALGAIVALQASSVSAVGDRVFKPENRNEITYQDTLEQIYAGEKSMGCGCCNGCGSSCMDLSKVDFETDALVMLRNEQDQNGKDPAFSTNHKFSHRESRSKTESIGRYTYFHHGSVDVFSVGDNENLRVHDNSTNSGQYFLARPKSVNGNSNNFNVDFERLDQKTIDNYRGEVNKAYCMSCGFGLGELILSIGGVGWFIYSMSCGSDTINECSRENAECAGIATIFGFTIGILFLPLAILELCAACALNTAKGSLNSGNLIAADPANAAEPVPKMTEAEIKSQVMSHSTTINYNYNDKSSHFANMPFGMGNNSSSSEMCSTPVVITISLVGGAVLIGLIIFLILHGRKVKQRRVNGALVFDADDFGTPVSSKNWGLGKQGTHKKGQVVIQRDTRQPQREIDVEDIPGLDFNPNSSANLNMLQQQQVIYGATAGTDGATMFQNPCLGQNAFD